MSDQNQQAGSSQGRKLSLVHDISEYDPHEEELDYATDSDNSEEEEEGEEVDDDDEEDDGNDDGNTGEGEARKKKKTKTWSSEEESGEDRSENGAGSEADESQSVVEQGTTKEKKKESFEEIKRKMRGYMAKSKGEEWMYDKEDGEERADIVPKKHRDDDLKESGWNGDNGFTLFEED